jgi:hypothetical protein
MDSKKSTNVKKPASKKTVPIYALLQSTVKLSTSNQRLTEN